MNLFTEKDKISIKHTPLPSYKRKAEIVELILKLDLSMHAVSLAYPHLLRSHICEQIIKNIDIKFSEHDVFLE